MKKYSQIFIITLLFIVSSCASVKVVDTWKSDDFSALANEKIVVVAKAKDINSVNAKERELSNSLEIDIANRLRAKGVNAVESHLKYPDLMTKTLKSDEDYDDVMQQIKSDNIKGILVTALKDIEVKTKIITERGSAAYAMPVNRAFISFRAYNMDLNYLSSPPALPPLERPEQTTVLKSKTYFLEAVVYDISLAEEKQLVGVIQADVTDPENSEDVVKGFSKIVAKQFKK